MFAIMRTRVSCAWRIVFMAAGVLLLGVAAPQAALADAYTANGCGSGCHATGEGGARINAANAPLVITAANANHAMGVGALSAQFATIAADLAIFNAASLGPQTLTVLYKSSNSITISSLVNDGAGAVITTTKAGTTAPTKGTIGVGTAGSFSVSYNHTGNTCGAGVDAFDVKGTGSADTADRRVNVNVTAPALTPSSLSPTIAYSTSPTAINLTLAPASVPLGSNISLGTPVPNEGTAVPTGALSFTYAASANPTVASVQIPFTINTATCGNASGTVTINITPAIISSGTISGTQGVAITTYQIKSIPPATGFSMSAPDIAALTAVGLSFTAGTGQITGTPTVAGPAFNVTVNATTSSGPVSRVVAITILSGGVSVVSGPNTATGATITGASAVTGTVGTALNIAYTASNPTISSVGSSGLPPGLSFVVVNGTTGAVAITGIPSQSQSTGNSNVFAVNLNATNGSGTGGNTSLTLTINPAVAPAVSNANLTPSQNTAFSYDFLTNNVTNLANAAKITFSATGLPPPLTINANSGVIAGTVPTSGGPTVATVTATNSFGSTNASVTFNVTPTSVPGITSPTAVSGTIGVPITPVQIVATNLPITTYGGSGLPLGITVSPSGLISGTPTQYGTFSATLTATNAASPPTGSLVVPFTIAPTPAAAGGATMTVPLNTATTVDFAPFITGTGITGVRINTTPAHGTATVNGTNVTYTPANNYFGTDTFTYAAFGAAGTSAPGIATVTIVGRPDPSADASVVGTINNQVETARRFSRSQISNYQRRMESLHRRSPPVSASSTAAGASGQASAGSVPVATGNSSAPLKPLPDLANPSPMGVAQNSNQTAPPVRVASLASVAGAADSAMGASGLLPPGVITTIMSAAQNRSLNLAALGGGEDVPGATVGSTSFWLGGDARFGTRDSTGTVAGTSFRSDGVSAGVDRRFSDQLVLGVGLGFAHDKADIGTDGTKSTASGTSAAFYGSYQPTVNTFIDGLLGYGTLSLDAERFVAPIGALAQSHRSGSQVFGSLAAGYEHRDKGLLVSPYGRLDFSVDKLNQASETGVGQFSLTYFDQTSRTLRSALGVRAEASHWTDWGMATPRIRVEYQHGFEGGTSANLAYTDLINGTRYGVTSSATDRNTLVLGLGSDLVLRNGLTLGVDYQILRSFNQETSQAIRFRLSKELGGKGPSAASLLPDFNSSRAPWGIRLDSGYTYDRNVSRGRDSAEKLSDQSYSFELSKGWIFPLSEHTRAVAALSGGAEKFRSYDGLSRLFGGALGELQYRRAGDFGAPTFALFTRLTGEQFESNLRDGYRYSVGVSVLKPVTDRISLFGALSHNERAANSSVFTGRDNSAKLNIDYAATDTHTLYVTTEYRRGDAFSSGLSTLASLDIAKVFARDDAFNDALIAYRIEATTVLATIGYNLPFGPRDALDFSWRRVQTTSVESAHSYGRSRYETDQFTLAYLLRF